MTGIANSPVCVEGLPASITMSLAIVANSLARKKVLCKSLMTVETLGACDTLLSDKTGSTYLRCALEMKICLLTTLLQFSADPEQDDSRQRRHTRRPVFGASSS